MKLAALALAGVAFTTPSFAQSAAEVGLNYWGDSWSGVSALPAQLRFAAGLGCYRRVTYGNPDHLLTVAQEDYLDDIVGDYVDEPCADVTDDTSTLGIQLKAHIADYHAARPNGKFIGYVDMTSLTGDLPGYSILVDADGSYDHRNWFVYRQGCNGSSTVVQYPECTYPDDVARDGRGRMMMDISKSSYLTFIADQIAREAADLGMDGIIVDVVHEFPFLGPDPGEPPRYWTEEDQGAPGNKCDWISSVLSRNYALNQCVPNTPETYIAKYNNWDGNWDDFFIALQAEIATTSRPNMVVYANIPRSEGHIATAQLPNLDGVMVEDFTGPTTGANICDSDTPAATPPADKAAGFYCRMRNIVDIKAAADAANKPLLLTGQTRTENNASWCGGPGGGNWDPGNVLAQQCVNGWDENRNPVRVTNSTEQHQYMRFYLAAYYIMQDGNVIFDFDHPAANSDQYSSQPWYAQFNCDLGTPDNAPLMMTSGAFNDGDMNGPDNIYGTSDDDSYVFTRSYSNGRVWLNTTNANAQVGPFTIDYYNSVGTKYPKNVKINVPADTGLMLYVGTDANPTVRCTL